MRSEDTYLCCCARCGCRLFLFPIRFIDVMTETKTLAGVLAEPSGRYDGDGKFFAGLLELVSGRETDGALGACIRAYVLDWLVENPLDGFDDYVAGGYRRTYLGRCPQTGWEALVMSWQEGSRTSVHAHPRFAGYFFADGKFRVEQFDAVGPGRARLRESVVVDAPVGFYAVGQDGSFENHIHRITCLSATGHSLHVYSDDALRGAVYAEEA